MVSNLEEHYLHSQSKIKILKKTKNWLKSKINKIKILLILIKITLNMLIV